MPIVVKHVQGKDKPRPNKASTALALAAILLLSAGIQYPQEAHAAGMTSHQLISYMVQQKATGKLKQLLDGNQDAYRNGSLFPDVAGKYLSEVVKWKGKYSSDDFGHGQKDGKPKGILNEYLKLMKDRCGSAYKDDETGDCKQARAFFLGFISHVVADVPWHVDFIGIAKTKPGVVSVTDRCAGSRDKAHDFADNDVDICMAKKVNGIDPPDVILYRRLKKAVFVRKNSRVGQGCPDGQWWHVGGGDGLLGACWKCNPDYAHDLGMTPFQTGVCFHVYPRKISCSQINQGTIGFSVTANVLRCEMVETGYDFAAEAYNRMNKMPGYEDIGKKTSKAGLIDTANTEYLGKLWKEQHAGKESFKDPGYAAKCAWGFKNAVDGAGGIKESAEAVRVFINKVWNHLQNNQDFAVVRFGTWNYGILRNGAVEHCVTSDKSKGCP